MEKQFVIEGPPFEIRLSTLDARFPGLYSRRLFVFKIPEDGGDSTVTVLREAIRKLVEQVPVLGGVADSTPDK